MYTHNRDAYRQSFHTAWQKYKKNFVLEPFEQEIIQIILVHPEYHTLLEKMTHPAQEYTLEENPFFHMALHLALREQLRMNKPEGIKRLYYQLLGQHADHHRVEHTMMGCLAEMLVAAQKNEETITDEVYFAKLQALLFG